MKKTGFYILIISFLNYVGCYSSRSVNKEILYTSDLGEPAGVVTIITNDEERIVLDDGNVTIITNDEERIVLDDGNYELVGDTLYANGINKTNTTVYGQPIDVKIVLNNIRSVEIEEPDGLATAGCFIGLTALVIVIVGISLTAKKWKGFDFPDKLWD